jgi:hypothetical protein
MEVFVVSRNEELVPADAGVSLILITLGGAISPVEVRAHLSSVYHISEDTAIHRAFQDRSSPRCELEDVAGGRHDPGGADGAELVVLDLTHCMESASNPMVLEAELAARSSVVPSVSRAIGMATCTSPDDEDNAPPPDSSNGDDGGLATSPRSTSPMILESLEERLCLPL